MLRNLSLLAALCLPLLGQFTPPNTGGGGPSAVSCSSITGTPSITNYILSATGTGNACAWGPPTGGGGTGTVTTSGSPTTGTLPLFSGSTVIGNSSVADNGTTVSTPEIFSALSLIAGSGSATSGYLSFSGATSGASGFSVANATGTSVLYLMPTSPSAGTTQFLQDTGSATCPTLPAGSPALCHQLAWAAGGGGSGALTQISQQVLVSPAATVTLTSIPGSFTSLIVKLMARSSNASATDAMYMQANGDTAAHYNRQFLDAVGSTVSAGPNASVAQAQISILPGATGTASYPGISTIEIIGYAQTTFFKEGLVFSGGPGPSNFEITNFWWSWASTSAITSLTLGMSSGANFIAGSTFTLYGVQ